MTHLGRAALHRKRPLKSVSRAVSNPHFLWKDALFIATLLGAQILGEVLAVGDAVSGLSFLLLAVWALTGVRNAIKAMLLSYVMSFLNPEIFGAPSYADMLRWLVLFFAASRVFMEFFLRGFRVPRWFLWLAIFCGTVAMLSSLASELPTVSYFKILSFFAGFATVFLAIEYSRNYDWLNWAFTLWTVVLLASLPLLVSDLGYVRNGLGFQGILNQPQIYGIFFAVPAFYLTIRLLLREFVRTISLSLFLFALWVTLIASQSRTSVLAGVAALFFSAMWVVVRDIWAGRLTVRTRLSPLSIVLGGIIVVAMIAYWGTFGQEVVEFTVKTSLSGTSELRRLEDVPEQLLGKRADIISASWNEFSDAPLTGIGFGVPSDFYGSVGADSDVFGIPLEAPVEKTFMPTAVLEETGLVGSALLTVFLIVLVSPILRYGDISKNVLFFTALFVNLGEMVFFSVGGGAYFWFCMGLARLWIMRNETTDSARAQRSLKIAKSNSHPPQRQTL